MSTKLGVVSDNPEQPMEGEGGSVIQLTPETIAEMRGKRLLREHEEQIDLPNFGPNEEKIGTLNDEERALFIESAVIDATLWDWSREISARSAERVAKHIREKDNPEEILEEMQKEMLFEDDDEAEQYYAEVYRKNVIDAQLWHSVRQRLQCFGANLAIRYGFAVARIGYKYKLKGK